MVMRDLQGLADRRHYRQRFFRLQLMVTDDLPQVETVHEFHQEEVKRARLSEIVNGDDIGVVQSCERLGFMLESLRKTRVPGAFWSEDFECHHPIELRLASLEDYSHPAVAYERDDFKLRKGLANPLYLGGTGLRGLSWLHRPCHEASRAEPFRSRLRERLAAART